MLTLSDYSILLLLAIVITLPLEFMGRLGIYRRYKHVAKALLLPLIVFVVWDIVFAQTDLWNFSKDHTFSFRLFGLPIEEILFFVFIPLAALLTYHAVSHMNKYPGYSSIFIWASFVVPYFGLGYLFHNFRMNKLELDLPARIHPYYFVITLIVALSFLLWVQADDARVTFIKSKNFFYSIVICLMFMIPFNGYLTRLTDPTVTYRANLGPRIFLDMPFEDVIYGFVLLSWVLIRYHVPKKVKIEV